MCTYFVTKPAHVYVGLIESAEVTLFHYLCARVFVANTSYKLHKTF